MTDKIQRCRELDDIEHSDATFGKLIDAASEKGRLATQLADDLEVALEALDELRLCAEYYANLERGEPHDNGAYARQKLDKIRGNS